MPFLNASRITEHPAYSVHLLQHLLDLTRKGALQVIHAFALCLQPAKAKDSKVTKKREATLVSASQSASWVRAAAQS